MNQLFGIAQQQHLRERICILLYPHSVPRVSSGQVIRSTDSKGPSHCGCSLCKSYVTVSAAMASNQTEATQVRKALRPHGH